MRAVIFDEAAPEQPAGERGAEEPKVQDLRDQRIRDMRPGVPAPEVPYLIDLTTRDMTPLPDAIVGSLATGRGFDRPWGNPRSDPPNRFAVSPDGSSLAFVGEGEDGTPQIFVAGTDGTGIRQVTRDPRQATLPAWSPDGTRIAYEGYGSGGDVNVFVLDVATGESRQITPENPRCPRARRSGFPCTLNPQFTPDGSSITYNDHESEGCCAGPVRTVPVAGGRSTLLIGSGEGAVNASLSPDGSLVTFLADWNYELGRSRYCGPCRFLANADGSDKRVITFGYSTISGTWSPDGTRIVLTDDRYNIRVVDVATGEAAKVAEGRAVIWLDDHTLLVEVW